MYIIRYNPYKEISTYSEQIKRVLILAIDVRGYCTNMVIDINNSSYEFNTAHEAKTKLPECTIGRGIWLRVKSDIHVLAPNVLDGLCEISWMGIYFVALWLNSA